MIKRSPVLRFPMARRMPAAALDRRNSLTSGPARSIRIIVKHLYEAIQDRVSAWRANRYPCADYPVIGEILDYARLPESEDLRFLRRPQLRALETYWYLRLIEETPKTLTSIRGTSQSRLTASRLLAFPAKTSG